MASTNITGIDLLINMLVQGFNIFLFLFIFKYFLADKIVQQINKRKQLLEKIKNAENEYKSILTQAQQEKQKIINEAISHKNKIIEEAKVLALKEKEKILLEAKKQSQEIIENAKVYGEKLKQQLISEWEDSLKKTSKMVVMKLFEKDVTLQEKYLEEIVKQFKR